MNRNPNPSEEVIDEALLNEALAEPTPAELEAKILALTDPAMLSLLDEALAPEAPSDQLTQRILAATQQHMQPGTVRVEAPANDTAVLARIGPSTLRYAAAAAITLAVGLGIYFVNQDPQDTDAPIADAENTPAATTENTLPDWLTDDQFASSDGYFQNATDVLEDAAGSLEDVTITRDTLWAELDAYEQFLDDFES